MKRLKFWILWTNLVFLMLSGFVTSQMTLVSHRMTPSVFNLGPGPINITVTCKQEQNSGRTCLDFYCDLEKFLNENQYVQAQLVVTAGDKNITSCTTDFQTTTGFSEETTSGG